MGEVPFIKKHQVSIRIKHDTSLTINLVYIKDQFAIDNPNIYLAMIYLWN